MGCSPPGSSVHGILKARVLEWVAISSSRGSSRPRDWTLGLFHLLHWEADSSPFKPPGKTLKCTNYFFPQHLCSCSSGCLRMPFCPGSSPTCTHSLTDCSPFFELVASSGHTSRGVMEGEGTSAVNRDVSSSLPLRLFSASNKLPGPVFFIFFLSLIASVT